MNPERHRRQLPDGRREFVTAARRIVGVSRTVMARGPLGESFIAEINRQFREFLITTVPKLVSSDRSEQQAHSDGMFAIVAGEGHVLVRDPTLLVRRAGPIPPGDRSHQLLPRPCTDI